MPKTSKELKKVLSTNEIRGEEISEVKKYIEATEIYEALVSSGLATKRGNNLLPPDKNYRFSIGDNP